MPRLQLAAVMHHAAPWIAVACLTSCSVLPPAQTRARERQESRVSDLIRGVTEPEARSKLYPRSEVPEDANRVWRWSDAYFDLREGGSYDAAVAKRLRNQVLNYLALETEIYLDEIKDEVFSYNAVGSSLLDVTVLTLTGLSTVLNPISTKTALSGAATVVEGSKLSLQKNIMSEKAIGMIESAMTANRDDALRRLQRGLKREDVDYDLMHGLADVTLLVGSGSLTRAVERLSKEAAQAAQQSAAQLRAEEGG